MSSLPLAGIRVLDLSRLLPGGFCSLLLADFGAEVLKVEDTGLGDYIRWSPPYHEGAEDSAKSALFLALNRNKRSVRVDLKHERGREVLLRLVAAHDVVLESFRPGVLDRLGVGYERMREVNPGVVYCAISGYGQTGPKRESSGHDMNYLGLVGLLGLTGESEEVGGHPVQAAGQIADLGGGALMAAFGILAALRERDGGPGRPGSGEGQVVDVSMADGALSWLAMVAGAYFADGVVPRRGGLPLAGSLVCYRPYACADGWVTLGALEPKFWQAWCRGVGREDLVERQFEAPGSEAHAQVVELFKARTRAQWQQFATEHDCCLEPVLELDEALDSELVRAREMVVELEQPGVAGGVRQLGLPVKLTRTPGAHNRLPGPALGEHTEQVLAAAGYAPEEIAALLECGAVGGPAHPAATAGQGATFRA
jgi:alpha-methylacyl-CoA racemase